MNRKIHLFNDYCYILMEILIMATIFLFAQSLLKETLTINYAGIIILCFLAITDYVLKMYCKNLFIYILGHAVFLPIILIAGFSLEELIPLGLIIIFQFIICLRYWSTEANSLTVNQLKISLFAVLVFIVIELYYTIMELNQLYVITYSLGLTFITLFFVRLFLSNMLDFFNSNEESKNAPFLKIFKMNSIYNVMLFAFTIILIIFTNITQVGRLIQYLLYGAKYVITALLRIFFSLFHNAEPLPEPEPIVVEDVPLDEAVPPDTNPILDFIMDAIAFIFILITLAIILYLIYLFFRPIVKRKIAKADTTDYTEQIFQAKKRKIHGTRKPLLSLFAAKTNNLKIRRIYFKKIKGFKDNVIHLSNDDTPREINEKIKAKTDASINKLTNIYEQARYGERELTKEDVEKAKSDK